MTTAERYRAFASWVARPDSPLHERFAAGVAGDREIVGLLDALPYEKRHPQLLFGSVRYLGGEAGTYEELRTWILEHRREVVEVMLRRRPQMNEVGRCAPVVPLLAALPQPLALLEVGASAGLCLYPDRYSYDFDGHRAGVPSSPVRLECPAAGPAPLPVTLPRIVWRAGLDANPLDVRDADDMRWLEATFWPGRAEWTERVRAAAAIARREPPLMVRGDLNEGLAELAARAPSGATLVVIHSAVLSYLDEPERERFVAQVRELDGHWISQELPHVLPDIASGIPRPPLLRRAAYVVALDGSPVAFAALHGEWLDWFGT
jgi:hypothetical protein